MIIEEIITKYAVDVNLFRLESTNPKKNPASGFFLDFIPGTYCRGAFVRVAIVRWLFVGGVFDLEPNFL